MRQFPVFLLPGLASAALVLAAATIPVASAEPPPPVRGATVEGITEYGFANGLRLLLYPDPAQAKVTVNMTVLVGSRHEGYGETGMAHLLEHLVFKGTPRHPHVPKELQEHGAQFNGSTSEDRTNYYETEPADDANLEFALDLEADRLVNSFIQKSDLDSEMTVVRNEFERGENSAMGVLMKRLSSVAYDWHNYGKSTIGNRSDIERVPIVNLQAFYRKFYQPDNVVLIVAGKFDEAKALALVQKYFGVIPRPARVLDATYTEEPEQDGERQVTLRRVGDGGVVGVAYHAPAGPHTDAAPLQILASVLSSQPSGLLYHALVEAKLATSASANFSVGHDPGLFFAEASVRDAATLDKVRDVLLGAVEGVATNGVTEEAVDRARRQFLRARERALADTAQMGVSLSEWAAQGDWRLFFLHRDEMEKVTPAQVQTVAAKYLRRNNRTVGEFIPTAQPERVPVPPAPDVPALVANYHGRAAVASGEAFEPTPENLAARAQHLELPEGVKAVLLPKHNRGGEVQLSLTLHYGNEENLKDLEGAAGFLPDLMLRGTKQLSYQQLRDELDRLEATLGSGAGGGGRRGGGRGGRGGGGGGALGSVSFSVQAKRETLPAVLELLRQVLREPALPAAEFAVMKRGRIAGLEQTRSEPATLAGRWLGHALAPYERDNIRYVPTLDESVARLESVQYEQVTRLYREYLGSDHGELTLIGDFEPTNTIPALRTMLAGWHAGKPYARITQPLPALPAPPATPHPINTPDKANATYTAALAFPLRDDAPDYPAAVLANYILGGGSLSSRLGNRIRQQDGLSYSVSSALAVSAYEPHATLTISAICNPTNITHVVTDVKEELERLVHDGITPEELEAARSGWLQAQKVRLTTDPAIAGLLGEQLRTGHTMADYAAQQRRFAALTKDEVEAAARKYFAPEKLIVVTAGDFTPKPNPNPQ